MWMFLFGLGIGVTFGLLLRSVAYDRGLDEGIAIGYSLAEHGAHYDNLPVSEHENTRQSGVCTPKPKENENDVPLQSVDRTA